MVPSPIVDIADYEVECDGTDSTANITNLKLIVFKRGPFTFSGVRLVINGKNATIETSGSTKDTNAGTLGTLNVSGVSAQIGKVNGTSSKSVELLLYSVQGYAKKTITVEGSRCAGYISRPG